MAIGEPKMPTPEELKAQKTKEEDGKDMQEGLNLLKMMKERKGAKLSSVLEKQRTESGPSGEPSQDYKDAVEGIAALNTMKAGIESGEKEKTKACSKCGKENGLSSNFCGSCGNKFETVKTDEDKITEIREKINNL